MALLSALEIETTWRQNGGRPDAADIAAAVALAESGGDTTQIRNTAFPNRPNYHPPNLGDLPEYSIGLWQINLLAHPQYTEAQLLTPDGNATAAIAISADGTLWGQWTTYTNGAYLAKLNEIRSAAGGPTVTPPVATTAEAPTAHEGWAALKYSVNTVLAGHLARGLNTLQDARVNLERATGGG